MSTETVAGAAPANSHAQELRRSHAEMRAAVLLAWRFVRKQLDSSSEAEELRIELNTVLKEAREIARANRVALCVHNRE